MQASYKKVSDFTKRLSDVEGMLTNGAAARVATAVAAVPLLKAVVPDPCPNRETRACYNRSEGQGTNIGVHRSYHGTGPMKTKEWRRV